MFQEYDDQASGDQKLSGFPFAFSSADRAFFAEEIHRRCGIVLGENKKPMMARRLSQRLRAMGLADFSAYRRLLAEDPNGPEWTRVISALTTNQTSFFREIHHFRALADHLKRQIGRQHIRIRLWSAACSTGEEAYSLAMVAYQVFRARPADIKILATDIDEAVLETARAGVYDEQTLSDLPPFAQDLCVRTEQGMITPIPEVRALISFKSLNLTTLDWPMAGPFDAILCRNVLIYFSLADRTQIIDRMVPLLDDEGLFCLGHSESVPIGTRGLIRGSVPNSYVKARL